MLFNSYEFVLVFLPIVLAGYYIFNHFKLYIAGKCTLVLASLYFYAYFEYSYFFIIAASITINYLLNKMMRCMAERSILRKWVLIGGLLANIGLLVYFKYFDFLITNVNLFLKHDIDLLHIVLPLGISFFTFQQLSYLVDSYRKEVPDYNILDYALFVTFFPQLVAGPIVLHSEMVPQFEDIHNKHFNYGNFSKGLYAFAIGMSKKILIADTFGKIVDFNYGSLSTLSSFEAVVTILAYTAQIYFDFSGYCDMATGIGWMFNIRLPQNFHSPYKAVDIDDFWKRWHMTLTRFLTKYVYIPLGGNRKGKARTYINIILVFLISGIWHGAGYTFILWGLLHGVASVLCKLFKTFLSKVPRGLTWLATFVFLNITWVYFRATSVADAHLLFSRVFAGGMTLSAELTETLLQPFFINILSQFMPVTVVIALLLAIAFGIAVIAKNTNEKLEKFQPNVITWVTTYGLLVVSILSLSGVSSFLYFNF